MVVTFSVYDEKYVLDIIYEPSDSTEKVSVGHAEKENPRDYSFLLQDQDPFSDSNVLPARASETIDTKLETSIYEAEEAETDPYWFPIIYPDHMESEAQDQNNEVPSDHEKVKREPAGESVESEDFSEREDRKSVV